MLVVCWWFFFFFFLFFFNDTATTEIYTLSLHDALPILVGTIGFRTFTCLSVAEESLNTAEHQWLGAESPGPGYSNLEVQRTEVLGYLV